jgi:hypothetical protein
MSPDAFYSDDDDSSLEEVALDTEKSRVVASDGVKQRRGSELGTMLRRLSSQTMVLTRSLTENLQMECAMKLEPGEGISRRQSLILARFIAPLEKEEVDENEDGNASVSSESSENSDFVGANRNRLGSSTEFIFRHQLSTTQTRVSLPSIVSDSEGDSLQ